MSGELIDTTEMYLRTIYELEEEGVVPLRARIAERLEQSGPTVSQTVARMERDGLVTVSAERRLVLTDEGRAAAVRVMRKHRLAERMLVDILGLDWADVHEEACRWEHVMSERVERRIVELLEIPVDSPYGNPIPGLAELDTETPVRVVEPIQSVTSLCATVVGESRVILRRIGEPLQNDVEIMRDMASQGVKPGVALTIRAEGGNFRLNIADQSSISLPKAVADHLFVASASG